MFKNIFRNFIFSSFIFATVSNSASALNLAQTTPDNVDVALVLAVDVSSSMTDEEKKVQKEGYAAAMVSNNVIEAIRAGEFRRIAVTYFEWGSKGSQRIIVPWTIIDSPEKAKKVSDIILKNDPADLQRTSLSSAMDFADRLFDEFPIQATHKVIDINGDGSNNDGEKVDKMRDKLISKGITINGLPMMIISPDSYLYVPHLDEYYKKCIISPDGFMIPIHNMKDFSPAVEQKLMFEVGMMNPVPTIRKVSDDQGNICNQLDDGND